MKNGWSNLFISRKFLIPATVALCMAWLLLDSHRNRREILFGFPPAYKFQLNSLVSFDGRLELTFLQPNAPLPLSFGVSYSDQGPEAHHYHTPISYTKMKWQVSKKFGTGGELLGFAVYRTWNAWQFDTPILWWIVALLGWITFVARACYRKLRIYKNRMDNICEQCGYDLRATKDRCPECGVEIHPYHGTKVETSTKSTLTVLPPI